jgi:hypothetical protein
MWAVVPLVWRSAAECVEAETCRGINKHNKKLFMSICWRFFHLIKIARYNDQDTKDSFGNHSTSNWCIFNKIDKKGDVKYVYCG